MRSRRFAEFERTIRRQFRRGVPQQDVDEFVQRVLLRAFLMDDERALDDERPVEAWLGWLARIERSRLWERTQRIRRLQRRVVERRERAWTHALDEEFLTTEERFHVHELVHAALEMLPFRDAQVLREHHLEGRRFADTAEATSTTPGAARVRAHRARAVLKHHLIELSGTTRDES